MELKYRLAIELITKFEGFSPNPYICPAGIRTIGYGRTTGSMTTTTKVKELGWLYSKLKEINVTINLLVNPKMTPQQMAALMSFIYNVGASNFKASTLLKRINAGDPSAADEFHRWNKAGKKILPGLVARRAAERDLFLNVIS